MLSKKIGLFLGPVVFITLCLLPVPEAFSTSAWRVIAIAAFMLTWWVTEAVPIAVAALLPVLLLPILGVMKIREAAAPYGHEVIFLFMGGFMLALAMERWNLHRRISLSIVRLTGTNADGVILGFMLATALLSMWISNTATTVMMLPIAVSVIDLLVQDEQKSSVQVRNFCIAMMLGIAYAANIGGVATIIGTPPNSVWAGFISDTYGLEVNFAKWMMIGVPFSAILLMLTYLFVVKWLYPNRLGAFSGARDLISREVKRLGPISRGEWSVLVVFLFAALCWVTRVPLNSAFESAGLPVQLSDAGIAVLAAILLFVIPTDRKFESFVLQWQDTEKLPWGILLLFGGGLSLAGALSQTGIIDLIGRQFENTQIGPMWVLLAVTAISLFLTEVMSNVALVTIFLPVVGGIAIGTGADPVCLTIPVTMAASCAFLLPMSTPPNAIVFASGHLTVAQMAKAGIVLNCLSVALIAILANWLVPLLFALPPQ